MVWLLVGVVCVWMGWCVVGLYACLCVVLGFGSRLLLLLVALLVLLLLVVDCCLLLANCLIILVVLFVCRLVA